MIESINNEKVKNWARLYDKKYQNISNLFIVEGAHLVEEAEKTNLLQEVIVLKDYEEEFNYANKTIVSEQVMKKISALTNIPKIIGIVKKIESREIKGNVIILDKIGDPGNLGTIIRSSVAFGIDTIILGDNCVNLYNPKVVRATEGLLFHINIVEMSLKEIIPELKNKGYNIYSTNVVQGRELQTVDFEDKTAIIMGNEGSGVDSDISSMCDEFLYIPMKPECESLNVGVATSIILYELHKKSCIK